MEKAGLVKVVLADPRQLMCEGIQRVLREISGIRVVGVARSKAELLGALDSVAPDVVLLNPRLELQGGTALIRELRKMLPYLPLLVLASDAGSDDPVALLRAGAKGYLSKDNDTTDMARAILKVAGGGLFVSAELSESLAEELCAGLRTNSFSRLSPREAEVFNFLAQGHTVSHIAQVLQLSVKTVSTHKSRMMERLGLSSLSELIQYAISNDLIDRGDPPPQGPQGALGGAPRSQEARRSDQDRALVAQDPWLAELGRRY
jgi:two-component system invasion response regulator UvrY